MTTACLNQDQERSAASFNYLNTVAHSGLPNQNQPSHGDTLDSLTAHQFRRRKSNSFHRLLLTEIDRRTHHSGIRLLASATFRARTRALDACQLRARHITSTNSKYFCQNPDLARSPADPLLDIASQHPVTSSAPRKFAAKAAKWMLIDKHGYRGDHLSSPAQLVQIDDPEVRITGQKCHFLGTLSTMSAANRLLSAFAGLCSTGPDWTGGRGGIRTHGTLAGTPVFKTGALNHSATLPAGFSWGNGLRIASALPPQDRPARARQAAPAVLRFRSPALSG